MRYHILGAVYVLLERDGKIVLLRRANTGWHDGEYAVPAGHLEEGETFAEAAQREALEEVGVTLDPHAVQFVHLAHRKSSDGKVFADVYFHCDKWEGEPKNNEPERCDDLRWSAFHELPENMVPPVAYALQCIQKGELMGEHGWGY